AQHVSRGTRFRRESLRRQNRVDGLLDIERGRIDHDPSALRGVLRQQKRVQAAARSFKNARIERLSPGRRVTREDDLEARVEQHLPKLDLSDVVRVLIEL